MKESVMYLITISATEFLRLDFLTQRKLESWWRENHQTSSSIFPKFSEDDMRKYLKELGSPIIPTTFSLLWERTIECARRN